MRNFSAFYALARGYWFSEEKWKARGLLAVVIALNFAAVYLLVQLNTWYNDFYNALQGYEVDQFWPLIGQFSLLAFTYILIVVYAIYLRQMVEIKWRTWMTQDYLQRWMQKKIYYRMQVTGAGTDNPDQRIAEDINQFVSITLQLFIGMLKQLTTLAAFGVVLWNLSGALTVPIGSEQFEIYGYMFWFSLLYSGLGTVLAHFVGRKLIGLNFDQQRYEADFRFSMMRVRENSESIAFYGGEAAEGACFKERFSKVIKNYWGLMRQTKLLNFYVNGYGQLAIIVPLILAAPRYFSGAMQLGGLMQTVSAFGRVQEALSYFVDSYAAIAQLAAVVRRLSGFTEHMEDAEHLHVEFLRKKEGDGLCMSAFRLDLPDGRTLLKGRELTLKSGRRTLLTGTSGAGKSTLLRTLAGIWPYGEGYLSLPKEKALFLPQKPYLPLGSLRRALSYPQGEVFADAELSRVLAAVGLETFYDKLNVVDDWSRILSLGEQQRIAFARVLLTKPAWLFLDEATSALDEAREQNLYQLLCAELPAISIVSVGHRSTLFQAHDDELHLTGDGNFILRTIAKI